MRGISAILLAYSIYKIVVEHIDEFESIYFIIALNAFGLLVLSFIPSIIERKWKVDIPEYLEMLFVIFCTGTLLVGEIGGLYETTDWWDAVMHTLSGVLITILGFYLINILNQTSNFHLKLRPIFAIIFVFCLTATIGVLWEIVEYVVDLSAKSNMQRFYNDIAQESFVGQRALDDTMMDFILNSVGSLIICIPMFFHLRWQKKKNELKNNS